MADAPQVMGCRQGHQGYLRLAYPRDGCPHGLDRHTLAITAFTAELQHRPLVIEQPRRLVGVQCAAGHAVDVKRQHADAVAVMAAQVGLDQMVGHQTGFGRRTAQRRQGGLGHVAHPVCRQLHPASLPGRSR